MKKRFLIFAIFLLLLISGIFIFGQSLPRCSYTYNCSGGHKVSCTSNSGDCEWIKKEDGGGVECNGKKYTCPDDEEEEDSDG